MTRREVHSLRKSKHRHVVYACLATVCHTCPLHRAVLNMVVAHVPSPDQLSQERVEKLMTSSSVKKFSGLPEATKSLKKDFVSCSSSPEAPLIVFVSKMFSVEKKQLPENRPKPLTQEELAARREHARKRHAERMAGLATTSFFLFFLLIVICLLRGQGNLGNPQRAVQGPYNLTHVLLPEMVRRYEDMPKKNNCRKSKEYN